jgi:hypothetical protein
LTTLFNSGDCVVASDGGARSVPTVEVHPLSSDDADGLRLKLKAVDGGAGRRLGALRAPILQGLGLEVVGVGVT